MFERAAIARLKSAFPRASHNGSRSRFAGDFLIAFMVDSIKVSVGVRVPSKSTTITGLFVSTDASLVVPLFIGSWRLIGIWINFRSGFFVPGFYWARISLVCIKLRSF